MTNVPYRLLLFVLFTSWASFGLAQQQEINRIKDRVVVDLMATPIADSQVADMMARMSADGSFKDYQLR